jgi:phosphatidylinositol alpha-1,6-mannosyltransferase
MKTFDFKFSLKKPDVFAITNSWPPMVSGHGRFFFQLLKNYDHKLVLAPTDNLSENSEDVLRLLRYSSINNPSKFKSLIQHLEILILPVFLITKLKLKPRIVIASQVLFSGLAAYFINLIFKIPYIIVAHGEEFSIYHNKKIKFKYILAKIVSKKSNIIICNTLNTSTIIEKFYSVEKSKMRIINPIVDFNESILDHESINLFKVKNFQDKKIILMTGRLYEERKGFDVAIDAFAKVKKQCPDVSLVIIGPGNNSKLYNLVVENNLIDDVHFLGKVDRKTLLKFYAICDVFLMPNRTLSNGDIEGFGLVFLEANMFGKPVIGGMSGGVTDAIENMISGLLVNGENVDEVSESLLKLLLDDDLRMSLGVSARRRLLSNFNEKTQTEKFHSVINELLKNEN